jgi:hypothetical protein
MRSIIDDQQLEEVSLSAPGTDGISQVSFWYWFGQPRVSVVFSNAALSSKTPAFTWFLNKLRF